MIEHRRRLYRTIGPRTIAIGPDAALGCASLDRRQRSTIRHMSEHRWHWLPIGLVSTGVVAVAIAAIANARTLGWWQALVYAGCLAAAAATILFRRKLSATEIELEALRRHLHDEQTRLSSERSQFEELRLAMQDEMTREAGRFGQTRAGPSGPPGDLSRMDGVSQAA